MEPDFGEDMVANWACNRSMRGARKCNRVLEGDSNGAVIILN